MNNKTIIAIVAIILIIIAGYFIAMNRDSEEYIEVTITDMRYEPGFITVSQGTTVRWINMNNEPHTVNSPLFESGPINPGDYFDYKFETLGIYNYVCAFHEEMRAMVVVE